MYPNIKRHWVAEELKNWFTSYLLSPNNPPTKKPGEFGYEVGTTKGTLISFELRLHFWKFREVETVVVTCDQAFFLFSPPFVLQPQKERLITGYSCGDHIFCSPFLAALFLSSLFFSANEVA